MMKNYTREGLEEEGKALVERARSNRHKITALIDKCVTRLKRGDDKDLWKDVGTVCKLLKENHEIQAKMFKLGDVLSLQVGKSLLENMEKVPPGVRSMISQELGEIRAHQRHLRSLPVVQQGNLDKLLNSLTVNFLKGNRKATA